jgi:RimJ/RimL family protein N-acetyltransferase
MVWPESFETARLRCERLRPEDRDEIRRLQIDPVVMTHLGGVMTDAQSEAYLTRNLAHWAVHDHGLWIVYERDGREPIGRALLRHLIVGDIDEVETGYAFYAPYWGRGYATEITRACLDAGFARLGLPSIVAVTTPDNAASQHVLTKCGFRFEREFTRDTDTLHLFRRLAP